MGNLADKRRLRKEAGELIHKGEAVVTEKDEMMFIPFIKSGSEDNTRPWLYKGHYSMPDGTINMEAKRYDGLLELKVEIAEKHKEYLSEAVKAFSNKIYEHSAHPVESISVEEHETEIDILKREVIRLELEASKAKAFRTKYKELLDEL